ncbi:MAG: 50S ribosomal protein L29 [Armatimonadetes bacterium]|nr:50S ribosomal protein L29 [Armatimonadota bacterium]
MKALKVNDLREKTVQELQELLEKERIALYDSRRKLVFREIKDVNLVREHRHNIARIMTLITEKKRGDK